MNENSEMDNIELYRAFKITSHKANVLNYKKR